MNKRFAPWCLILLGWMGMAGLFGWHVYAVRQAVQQSNQRWVNRVSALIAAERASLNQWINQYPSESDTFLRDVATSREGAVALFVVNHKTHETQRWLRRNFEETLEPLDPRLNVLQLRALETGKSQIGPIIFSKEIPHATVLRPLDDHRVLIAFVRFMNFVDLLNEESTRWHIRSFVYDFEGHNLFGSGDTAPIELALHQVIQQARIGVNLGALSLKGKGSWQWLGTFHYDPSADLIFIILQWTPWVYSPPLFFLISLLGILMLARMPFRAAARLRRIEWSDGLANFAARVENFIRGRDTVLKEPPPPFQALIPIVRTVHWMMPQWKKAEAFPRELGLERKLLALLIESLPEGILFFNAQGGLQLSNELGRVFLALHQEAGRETRMFNGIQIPRGFLEPFMEPVLTGAQPNLGKEIEVPWADGKHLYRVWVERVEGEPDKVMGFIVVIRDITFRKQWEYVQEQVLSGITHDLRGPLSSVMGYIDLIRRQIGNAAPPKIVEYLQLAREAGLRLSQMVADILDVVRFEQGKIDLQSQAIAVADIFQRLRNTFGVLAEQKKITLKATINGDATMKLWGDPKLLERVFDNLVGNAIKFTPSEGTITVTGRRDSDRLIFEVADTGRGIPREAQSRLFDKFQQVRPGDRSSGYGLGLAVVKFIVEAHKGEIRVESDVGVGSRFTFWIPEQSASSVAVVNGPPGEVQIIGTDPISPPPPA